MYINGEPILNICKTLNITKPTLYKHLKNGKNRYNKIEKNIL